MVEYFSTSTKSEKVKCFSNETMVVKQPKWAKWILLSFAVISDVMLLASTFLPWSYLAGSSYNEIANLKVTKFQVQIKTNIIYKIIW